MLVGGVGGTVPFLAISRMFSHEPLLTLELGNLPRIPILICSWKERLHSMVFEFRLEKGVRSVWCNVF